MRILTPSHRMFTIEKTYIVPMTFGDFSNEVGKDTLFSYDPSVEYDMDLAESYYNDMQSKYVYMIFDDCARLIETEDVNSRNENVIDFISFLTEV